MASSVRRGCSTRASRRSRTWKLAPAVGGIAELVRLGSFGAGLASALQARNRDRLLVVRGLPISAWAELSCDTILKSPCPMAANSAVAGPKHGRYKPFAVCGMLRHSPPAAELHGRPASHAFLRKRSANDGNRSPLAAQLKRGVAAAYCGLSPVSAIRGVGRSTTVIARRRQDRRRAAQEHEVSPRRRLSRPRVDRAADPRQ